MVICPQTEIKLVLWLVQEPLGLQVPGVYKIPCVCRAHYIGQMGRSVMIRRKEQK